MAKIIDLSNRIDEEVSNRLEFNLNTFGLNILKKIIKKNNRRRFELPLRITSSSGSVLVLIYPSFVIKVFIDAKILEKVIEIMKIGMQSKFSIQLYGDISTSRTNIIGGILEDISIPEENFYALVTETISPLISHHGKKSVLTHKIWENELVLMKLFLEIGDALSFIHDGIDDYTPYTHGDTTLDNIGFKDGRFVLFDFNSGSLTTGNTKADILNLIRSVRYNLSKDGLLKDKLIIRFLDFLSNSPCKNGYQLVTSIFEYYKEYYDEELENIEIFDILTKLTVDKI